MPVGLVSLRNCRVMQAIGFCSKPFEAWAAWSTGVDVEVMEIPVMALVCSARSPGHFYGRFGPKQEPRGVWA